MKDHLRPLSKKEILNLRRGTMLELLRFEKGGFVSKQEVFLCSVEDEEIIIQPEGSNYTVSYDGFKGFPDDHKLFSKESWDYANEIWLADYEGSELQLMPIEKIRKIQEYERKAIHTRIDSSGGDYGCGYELIRVEIDSPKDDEGEALAVLASDRAVKENYSKQERVCSPYDCTGEAFGSSFKLLDAEYLDRWVFIYKHSFVIDI